MSGSDILLMFHLILLIVACSATIIIGITGLCETEYEMEKSKSYITVPILFIATAFLLVFYIYGSIRCEKAPWEYNETPYASEKIVSLNDNNMINGRFYVRRGYINEDLYYQYMVQLSNGGFVANKVKATNATLFYDADNYRVEWYTRTKGWLYFTREETYNEIYIPEGSITDDYSIDLN